ncbi:SusC/RagA family TonB-linked outer membrane protein [Chitinophaga sp. SYP-B3965]|uniref:SusC/RagA family TonB-linked outer membrane protein n=1 Tax=Chitinophaga sp. SYP-B3965 TaxID=2663120 RepID=UPI001299967B|nr:SusC/RagA family TonB-linked outer membrane protein [Chitinophaga sp. SYP-B3965]MRG47397.1 SusC/RagA family TonB-linked outer membrane protein [Chitinophaga sp. SYP-B3965]
MKKLHLAFLCLFLFHQLNAQTVQVTGVITDALSKDPLPGVTIRIKSTNRGTTADVTGKYTITVDPSAFLEITFIGYTTQTIKVGSQRTINVSLELTNSSLQETVVIGYQTITRRNSTAAISSISGKELQNLPSSGFDQLLQGRLSGVNVQNFTGEPGARSSVVVRGNSTANKGYDEFNAINSPLYVVDGIPQPTESYVGPNTGTGTNYLAGINPVDIESVDVLKDASAAAIYGSRAAYGVILITTKKGRTGGTKVNVSGYYGVVQRPELRDVVVGAAERRQKLTILEERIRYADRVQLPYMLTDSLNPAFNSNTDWQDMFYRVGAVRNADMSISGGSADGMTYRFSSGYYDEEGIVRGTDLKRYTSRLTLNTRALNNKLEITPMIFFSHVSRHRGDGDAQSPISISAGAMPSSLFNLDPNKKQSILGSYDESLDGNVISNFNINLTLGYYITKHLKLTSQNSYLYLTTRRDYNRTNELNSGAGNLSTTYADNQHDILSSNYLSYINSLDDHSFSVVLGTDIQFDKFQNMQALGYGGVSDQIQVIQGFRPVNTSAYSDYQSYGLLSYYARFSYSYKNKYLLSFSGRGDGSSRFGENSKWGYFPSASVGWILSDESFINVKPFSMIKIRGSYGTSGSLPKQNYLQYNLYRVNNGGFDGNFNATSYNGITAVTPNFADGAAQPGLSWEKSSQWNVGTDFEIGQTGRVSGSIDVYNKESTLQLFSIELPVTSGYDNALTNAIGVRNSGLEVQLAAYPLNPKNAIRWRVALNASYNKNEVMSLPNGGRDLVLQGDRFDKSHILSIGKPLNAFYLYKTQGVYLTDDDVPGNKFTGEKFRNGNYVYRGGDFRFADLDGDNFIDIFNDGLNPDKIAVGDPNPKVTGGFINDFYWKNFGLSIFCTFTLDRDVLNLYESDQFSNSTAGGSVDAFAQFATPDFTKVNIWRQPGDKAEYAKYDIGTYGYYYTSAQTFFLEKGGYFRVKNISLSYNLGKDFLRKFKLDRLRIFSVMDNVLMIQQSKKLPDAEAVNRYGEYNGAGYPIPKKYTLGFDINF